MKELKIDCDVEEKEQSPIDNVMNKACNYHKLSKMPTIALDEGLFLEGIPKNI